MALSDLVRKNTRIAPPRVLLYGPPGIGKSTFVAMANGLILDTEDGAGAIEGIPRIAGLETWPQFRDALNAVASDDHEYKLLGIDTIDWLFRRIEEHVTGSRQNTTNTMRTAHGGWGSGKDVMLNIVYGELIPLLNRITARGVSVIMLAHATHETYRDIDGIETQKAMPDLPKSVLATMIEYADIVACAREQGNERMLVLRESPSHVAKFRYGNSGINSCGMSWEHLKAAIVAGRDAQRAQASAKPAPATPETGDAK